MAVARADKRGRLAVLTRYRDVDDPELVEAKRDYWCQEIIDHIQQVAAEAPPLTNEQLAKITAILYSAQKAGPET